MKYINFMMRAQLRRFISST